MIPLQLPLSGAKEQRYRQKPMAVCCPQQEVDIRLQIEAGKRIELGNKVTRSFHIDVSLGAFLGNGT
jgi:hypothetical protein